MTLGFYDSWFILILVKQHIKHRNVSLTEWSENIPEPFDSRISCISKLTLNQCHNYWV